jgi:hypothetical protein
MTMAKKIMNKHLGVVFLASCLGGCMATTGNHRDLASHYPPKSADCDIPIYRDVQPDRPYAAISRLNVHLEKTFFLPSDFASAVGELRRQGCLSGADGIVDIQEQSTHYLETRIYNLSATGIRFDNH